jgi:hypothetical protein
VETRHRKKDKLMSSLLTRDQSSWHVAEKERSYCCLWNVVGLYEVKTEEENDFGPKMTR